MKLWVVIVNYRTGRHVLLGLPKLLAELDRVDAGVVIVDNDSGDGSLEEIGAEVERQGWGARVRVVSAHKNGGFGAGNNFGIRYATDLGFSPEHVLLINPDAYPEPGCVSALLDFMEGHPSTAIAGAAIRAVDGSPGPAAFRYPSVIGEFVGTARIGVISKLLWRWLVPTPPPGQTRPADWVSGCCMMLRASALEEIGLFDEGFFLYFEEVDLCRRAREKGWSVDWVKEARVVHDEGGATGIRDRTRRRPRYWFDSRRRYFLKSGGRLVLWAANGAWLAGSILYRARNVTLNPRSDPPNLLVDFVRWTMLEPSRADLRRASPKSH